MDTRVSPKAVYIPPIITDCGFSSAKEMKLRIIFSYHPTKLERYCAWFKVSPSYIGPIDILQSTWKIPESSIFLPNTEIKDLFVYFKNGIVQKGCIILKPNGEIILKAVDDFSGRIEFLDGAIRY